MKTVDINKILKRARCHLQKNTTDIFTSSSIQKGFRHLPQEHLQALTAYASPPHFTRNSHIPLHVHALNIIHDPSGKYYKVTTSVKQSGNTGNTNPPPISLKLHTDSGRIGIERSEVTLQAVMLSDVKAHEEAQHQAMLSIKPYLINPEWTKRQLRHIHDFYSIDDLQGILEALTHIQSQMSAQDARMRQQIAEDIFGIQGLIDLNKLYHPPPSTSYTDRTQQALKRSISRASIHDTGLLAPAQAVSQHETSEHSAHTLLVEKPMLYRIIQQPEEYIARAQGNITLARTRIRSLQIHAIEQRSRNRAAALISRIMRQCHREKSVVSSTGTASKNTVPPTTKSNIGSKIAMWCKNCSRLMPSKQSTATLSDKKRYIAALLLITGIATTGCLLLAYTPHILAAYSAISIAAVGCMITPALLILSGVSSQKPIPKIPRKETAVIAAQEFYPASMVVHSHATADAAPIPTLDDIESYRV